MRKNHRSLGIAFSPWILLYLIVNTGYVYADQITDIGITRSELQSLYQEPWLAFTFEKESQLWDGTPRVRAECNQCPKGFLSLELIGPAKGYIQTAHVTLGMTARLDEACISKGKLALLGLLDKIFPQWKDDVYTHDDWLSEALMSDGNETMYRNGLRISLTVLKPRDGRILTLTVDSD